MFRTPHNTPARPGGQQETFNMKAPKAPDRPLVPYMRYSRKMWAKVRADNPDAQLWDIGKLIGQMWRDLPDEEKAVFQAEYEVDKIEWEKAMKVYHNSASYQQYMSAKNRAKQNEKSSRSRMDAGGVVIQPVDEDESNNELSARRLAAVRFDRNHRLIAELFSPLIVADTRTVVAQSRIEMLRKQALQLSSHQNKLEEELTKLAETHADKKKQIEQASDAFAVNLKKVCDEKPVIDEARLDECRSEWEEKLKEAYVDYKKKQDEINAKLAAEREKKNPVLFNMVMGDSPKAAEEGEQKEVEGEKKEEQKEEKAEQPKEAEKEKEEKKGEEKPAEKEQEKMEE